jgi:2,3-bisphosphoglycerate-dependent phosphoglycerate mutase
MTRLVLMRHGESVANSADRFGGWQDVRLTERGIVEARAAGLWMLERGFAFSAAFSSKLRRATHSAWHVLDVLEQTWVPVQSNWRLNERHYGVLEGMSKADAVARFGAEQVQAWRRGYDQTPPAPSDEATRMHRADRRYADIEAAEFPCGESLRDVERRLLPFWASTLEPALRSGGGDVLVVSHGNTLRALMRLVEASGSGAGPDEEIPTAVPIVYRLTSKGWRRAIEAEHPCPETEYKRTVSTKRRSFDNI